MPLLRQPGEAAPPRCAMRGPGFDSTGLTSEQCREALMIVGLIAECDRLWREWDQARLRAEEAIEERDRLALQYDAAFVAAHDAEVAASNAVREALR